VNREIRRRFRYALLGYIVLAIGVAIGLGLMWQSIQGYRQVQRELRTVTLLGIRVIGKGQVYDCLDRQIIRDALHKPPPPGKYGDCHAIAKVYAELYQKALNSK